MQKLEAAVREAPRQPDVQARLASLDLLPEALAGAAAQKRLDDLSERYARIAAATGMHPE